MISRPASQLSALGESHPEWRPWLTVLGAVVVESADLRWDAAVPTDLRRRRREAPLLSKAELEIDRRELHRWIERLFRLARDTGSPQLGELRPSSAGALEPVAWFYHSLCPASGQPLNAVADQLNVSPEALEALVALVAVPFLNACERRWGTAAAENWSQGYCPLCGAWPALLETRGIERVRSLRCCRCGTSWNHPWLYCPYCGMDDHQKLMALVPEAEAATATRTIEACTRCGGYVKTITTLEGGAGARVIIDDLATVELDVAALEKGLKRPTDPGYHLDVAVRESRSRWYPFG